MQFSLQNVLVDDKGIVIGEGIDSCNHFVYEDTKGPPIHWFSMPLILQDFWSKVFRRSAERESPSFDDLSKSEIRQFQIAICSNKYVFWFEIAIDDILAVQILENRNNVGGVKAL